MLQIASGKFYQSADRHVSNGHGVFYSNYNWVAPIETKAGRFEPIDLRSAFTGYLFSYQNQMENAPGNILVRVGDGEILDQFRAIACFGLRAAFSEDRAWVAHACRTRSMGGSDLRVPSSLLPRYFDAQVHGSEEETQAFAALVGTILDLSRKDFISVIAALRTFTASLEVLATDLSLAYSMLVYALESLVQKTQTYTPEWSHYGHAVREKLEPLFEDLACEKTDAIKSALLEDAHLKLQGRFIEFITGHLDESYFTTAAQGIDGALKRSELRPALENLYGTRSGFVHELRPLMVHLHQPALARADVFRWFGVPHFTFCGLIRLTQHVVRKFIATQPSAPNEEGVNWRAELPDVIMMPVAPHLWVPRAGGFNDQTAHKFFSGFLSMLADTLETDEPMQDIPLVLVAIEMQAATAKKEARRPMIALYAIYNQSVPLEFRRPDASQFLKRYHTELDAPHIESMAAYVFLADVFPWSLADCEKAFAAYLKARGRPNRLVLPPRVETAIMIALANTALKENDLTARTRLLEDVIYNTPGNSEVQRLAREAQTNNFVLTTQLALPRKERAPVVEKLDPELETGGSGI